MNAKGAVPTFESAVQNPSAEEADLVRASASSAPSAAASSAPERRGPRRSARRPVRAKDIVLGITGVLGLLALLWALAGVVFGIGLVIFTTGSMSPTMPQGSAGVSLPISADRISVGDVITVQRAPGELPVTHRVVSVSPGDASRASDPAERIVTLQGDANSTVDRLPYRVTEARLVLVAVPMLGTVITFLQTPLMIGGLTLLAGVLVAWAFWPSSAPRRRPGSGRHVRSTGRKR